MITEETGGSGNLVSIQEGSTVRSGEGGGRISRVGLQQKADGARNLKLK